jgi:hypothetical protein
MRNRTILAIVAVAAVACVALVTLALLPPRPGVPKANLDRIKIGMTTMEVEAIFGESTEFIPWPPQTGFGRGELEFLWSGNDGQAVIEFKDLRVRDKQWRDASTTWPSKFRSLLRL